MKNKIEEELSDEQAAYRKGRGTVDILVNLQVLIGKVLTNVEQAFIFFIDYSKAFDLISHVQQFNIMIDMGFPNHLVALLQNLYLCQSAVIHSNGNHTESFPIEKGVRQGCICSPPLFSLYTEQIMREADISEEGIPISGRRISNLRYADDTALLTGNEEHPEHILNRVNEVGMKRLLKLNVKKTKYMSLQPSGIIIETGGEQVEKVTHFKYLGLIITSDGSCKTNIINQIAMAKKRMLELTPIWKDRGV